MPIFSPRTRASASSLTAVISWPSTEIRPDVGASSPAINPRIVDLPLPDGPVIATMLPRSTVNDVGCRIVSGPAPLVTVREPSVRTIMSTDTIDHLFQLRVQQLRDRRRAGFVR